MTHSSDTRIIMTNHARARLNDRKVSEYEVRQTILYPDSTGTSQNNAVEFRKKIGAVYFTVIALHKNDGWVILSIWRNPPAVGTADARHSTLYQAYQKSGFWGKIWIIVREQFGF
ncbi:MAG: DUF4258 domain-containing protein [Candidatus Roizmanbacteria bacterium]|nr:DUF4258 domain-containing protein [Candidatus Roizmanbacteria bacterium]